MPFFDGINFILGYIWLPVMWKMSNILQKRLHKTQSEETLNDYHKL